MSHEKYFEYLANFMGNNGPIISISEQPLLPHFEKLHSYRVVLQNKCNEKFTGLGSDLNIKLAIIKASNEAIGKYALGIAEVSEENNGVAVHEDQNMAREKSLLELIERDHFMISWLTQTVPYEINIDSLRKQKLFKNLKKLKKNCKSFHVLGLTFDIPIFVIGVLIVDRNLRVCLGLGTDWNFEGALTKALIESLRLFGMSGQWTATQYDKTTQSGNLYWHWTQNKIELLDFLINNNLTDYKDYYNAHNWIFCFENLLNHLKEKDVQFLKIDAGVFHDRTHVVKSYTSRFQQCFLGIPEDKKVNHQRIEELGLKWNNHFPHPLN